MDKIDENTSLDNFKKAVAILEGRWSIQILHELHSGKKRFNELKNALKGISPKILSTRLKELEREGIITKTIYAEAPPRVEYSLSPKGTHFDKIVQAITEWGGILKKEKVSAMTLELNY